MKHVYNRLTSAFFLLLFSGTFIVYAQSFEFKPKELIVYGKPGDRIGCKAEVKNLSSSTLRVDMNRIRNDIPVTWMSSFCLNQCYAPFTDRAQEDIPGNTTLEFTIYFDTDSQTEESGEVEMELTNTANTSEKYTLVFKAITSNTVNVAQALRPSQSSLKQNYPNPFGQGSISKSTRTFIEYTVQKAGNTSIVVYDMLGREVKSLVNTHQAHGIYRVDWDGTNNAGQEQPSGIYLVKFEAGEYSKTKRMILLR